MTNKKLTPHRPSTPTQHRPSTPDVDPQGRRRSLTPTGLAQYLSLDSCDRFLHMYLYKGQTDKLAKQLQDNGLPHRVLQPIGPLMAELGDRIETRVIQGMQAQGHTVFDLTDLDLSATLAKLQAAGTQPVYLYQAQVLGQLGKWQFEGRADLIRVQRDANGRLQILVCDVKSTRQDKVSHRLQVAIYIKMVESMLIGAGIQQKEAPLALSPRTLHKGVQAGEGTISVGGSSAPDKGSIGSRAPSYNLAQNDNSTVQFQGAVVRRNGDGTLQNPDTAVTFELDPYFSAIDQLAIASNSALGKVEAAKLEDLHYYLNQKCDSCLFNRICMVESGERQDVALVPFLESADKRALNEQGIRTVGDLASLKNLPKSGGGQEGEVKVRSLKVKPETEAVVAALAKKAVIAPKLDRFIQRAARVHNRLNKHNPITAYSYFFDAKRSVLPDDSLYPDMVKVFLDVQTDYLEDRVYLAGAHIVGPNGSESIIKMTPSVPDEQSEREMLTAWVTEILAAVLKVAAEPTATPVHLYLYNRHDQRFLLEALRRHLDVFAAIPALYSLLTESPALTQSAVSFVYDEVKERRNLPSTGHTLQSVATQLGFKWEDGADLRYYRIFEQGMFDYLWKRNDGSLIESAARFYSTIPLEYAYAAWGIFKAEDFKPQQRGLISGYLKVKSEQIKQFQAKRLTALAYIEASFKYKNAYLKKEPLNLLQIGATLGKPPSFKQVLEEFLYIEHYANLQEHLEFFSQPVTKRVQSGRSLLLECIGFEDEERKGKQSLIADFVVDFSGSELDPAMGLQLCKIKAGDFVVLNKLEKDAQPWEMLHGRLGVVRRFEKARISIDLTNMTFKSDKTRAISFRYYHDNALRPTLGEFFTLDEMVDDLNGDRLVEGCKNAEFNPFYHLISSAYAPDANQRKGLGEGLNAQTAQFVKYVAELEADNAPTAKQGEVIAARLDEKVFLVQGPPGTGKSHTLGWAVLARMFAEAGTKGGTMRVAVSCQTHNAVSIVLQSIATKLKKLKEAYNWEWLDSVQFYKVGEETESNTMMGVARLDAWDDRFKLNQIFNSRLVVIGGTPGGLYKIMQQSVRNKSDNGMWKAKPYDLVILDESSQMNIPQAVLASSWLREDGQLIVVGDHRQMAPILTHSWEEESRLSSVSMQPYRSVFQYLVDQNFPKVALDESFRLHRVQAEFLQHSIYHQDGINFFSKRQAVLSHQLEGLTPYLQAVLHPDYPIIVVEHSESGSQQANPTEAALIAPIVEVCSQQLGLGGAEGIGVVVPHRAQKALLREYFPHLAEMDAIDTVERFQGDEREVIIVSATASDPDYVLAEAEFLLNPNRFNVALSRPKRKLIVVASTVVFRFLSADLEIFEQAVLWKRLLSQWARELLWEGDGVRVYGCKV